MTQNSEQMKRAAERQHRAYQLHLGGATYQQIADQLEYKTSSGAHNAVRSELERQQVADGPVENVPSELARLDAMLVGLWPKARRGDVYAIDRVLKIGERRAALLSEQADAVPPEKETGLDEFTRRLNDRQASSATVDHSEDRPS